jgi:hypothetical protein
MDKGIRPECNRKFRELLPTRENTRAGNTAFRKTVMAHIMTEFGITLASAATHYNHAFIDAREAAKTDATLATQLVGLGRPEDKKGGRKPKAKPEAAATPASTESATVGDVVNSNVLGSGDTTEGTLVSEGVKENTSVQTVTVNEAPQGDAPVQKYSVCKSSDKTVVCSDLTLDEANALIDKAAKAKKAKLELVA